MGNSRDDEDDAALRKRLKTLTGALSAREEATKTSQSANGTRDAQRSAQAMSVGVRVLSEFVGAVVVGAFLGWALDRWLGSAPWGLAAFLTLGLAAGLWNVYRIAKASQVDGEPR